MARLTRPGNRPQTGGFWPNCTSQLGWAAPAVCRSQSVRSAGFAMLLTRRACYLIAAKHLAEHAGEGSFSAHDLAECYGLPHEALAKVLQRLSTAGVLMSHHGIKVGYTLARDRRYISVFDVIEAREGPRRSGIHGERWRHLESVPGYHQLRMVHHVVADTLRELTIEDCYNLCS
jgi:Rrf2 family protein